MHCNVKVSINSKFTYINAIIDTGNFLREPITKMPVIVVEKESLRDIIPDYILNNLDKIINGEDINLDIYSSKVRIIPFTSLGKENGILLGIKADNIVIELEEQDIIITDVIVGIYNGKLSKNGKYSALIGLDLLESKEKEVKENEYITNIKV